MRDRLVERAMGGDQAAFSALAADAVDGCYRLAYRILRDPHRAQDATQQALLAAWRDLPTLRDPSRFDAWLHRLVIHACYAEARSDRRWVARVRAIPTSNGARHVRLVDGVVPARYPSTRRAGIPRSRRMGPGLLPG